MKTIPSKKFEKKVAKLPATIKKILANKLCIFVEDPSASILNNHALQGDRNIYRSINITSDYRLIYEQNNIDTVRLIDIDTHSNLY